MLSTKQKGNASELKIAARLIQRGYTVLFPYGENNRYDLVVDIDGSFYRIQCKTATLQKGRLAAKLTSTKPHLTQDDNVHTRKHYKNEIDFFAIYSPDLDKCYIIPISECPNNYLFLRVDEALGSCQHQIRYAVDYEL